MIRLPSGAGDAKLPLGAGYGLIPDSALDFSVPASRAAP